jgi:hypothetical protein
MFLTRCVGPSRFCCSCLARSYYDEIDGDMTDSFRSEYDRGVNTFSPEVSDLFHNYCRSPYRLAPGFTALTHRRRAVSSRVSRGPELKRTCGRAH